MPQEARVCLFPFSDGVFHCDVQKNNNVFEYSVFTD